jgi:glutaryl-CoA dehydrogenase
LEIRKRRAKNEIFTQIGTGEFMGCFGLTEPNYGSDPGSMITNFKDMGDHYLLNGAKMWISNAPFADIAVVWQKMKKEDSWFNVERMEGFTTLKRIINGLALHQLVN